MSALQDTIKRKNLDIPTSNEIDDTDIVKYIDSKVCSHNPVKDTSSILHTLILQCDIFEKSVLLVENMHEDFKQVSQDYWSLCDFPKYVYFVVGLLQIKNYWSKEADALLRRVKKLEERCNRNSNKFDPPLATSSFSKAFENLSAYQQELQKLHVSQDSSQDYKEQKKNIRALIQLTE